MAPYDVVPEAVLGPEGYIEDVFLCAYVVRKLDPTLGRQKLMEHWTGDEDIISVSNEVYKKAEEPVGKELKKIIRYVGLDSVEEDVDE